MGTKLYRIGFHLIKFCKFLVWIPRSNKLSQTQLHQKMSKSKLQYKSSLGNCISLKKKHKKTPPPSPHKKNKDLHGFPTKTRFKLKYLQSIRMRCEHTHNEYLHQTFHRQCILHHIAELPDLYHTRQITKSLGHCMYGKLNPLLQCVCVCACVCGCMCACVRACHFSVIRLTLQ